MPAAMEPVEGPWELPEEWRWERLGELCEYVSRGRSPAYVSAEGVPVINQRCIRWDGIDFSHCKLTSREMADRVAPEQRLREGDVLWNSTGTGTIGRASVIERLEELHLADSHVTILRPSRALPRWITAWIGTHFVQQRVAGIGSTNQVELSRDTVLNMPIPFVDHAEQERIVARIDALFAEIEEGEQALAEARAGVETYRKALLKAAVTGELTADWRRDNKAATSGTRLLERILDDRRKLWTKNPRNHGRKYVEPCALELGSLPALPKGWCWASVDQVAFVSGGVTVDAKRRPADPVEVPYLRVANVQRGFLDLAAIKTIVVDRNHLGDLSLRRGDVLLNEGGDRDKVGRGWVWEGQLEPCIHQNHVFKARPASRSVHSKMLSMYLNELGRSYFLDESKQTTNLASISRAKVIRAPVPIAPIEESEAAMRLFDELADVGGSDSDEGLELLQTLRQSVLAAAFRGELAA